MLFTYIYIPHPVEKLQEYLDFLFFEVWIPAQGTFNFDLLRGHPELHKKCLELEYADTQWGNFFNRRIADIHDAFAAIDDSAFKDRLRQHYVNNNDIAGLCANKDLQPLTYKELEAISSQLAKAIKKFYKRLYGSDSPFNLETFGSLSKKLLVDHYREFVTVNDQGVCAFCGTAELFGNNHSCREAYDHYLPKGIFPFNNLNFSNLVPACDKCNSKYKLSKVPIYKRDKISADSTVQNQQRSLAFFPYAEEHPHLEVKVSLKSKTINKLAAKDVELDIRAPGFEEQIQSWMRVYGIEERYKAKMCSKSEGLSWFQQIWDEAENLEQLSGLPNAITYLYKSKMRAAEQHPNRFADDNFLKVPFLQACNNLGLFDR